MTTLPTLSTPCTWNTFLARSTPMVLTCIWTTPSGDSLFNDHSLAHSMQGAGVVHHIIFDGFSGDCRLAADVFPDHRFVSTDGRDEVSPSPEVLPYKVALPLSIDPRQVDSALALDVPNHLRHIWVGSKSSCEHDPASNAPLRPCTPSAWPICGTPLRDAASIPHTASSCGTWDEDHVIFALPLAVA